MLQNKHMSTLNIPRTRRNNLLLLIREFTEAEHAAGRSPLGLMGRCADSLGLSAGGLSQFKGEEGGASYRNIGDAVAAQLESRMGKPKGWMDLDHGGDTINPAEIAFLEKARDAWRSTDAKGRRHLAQLAKRAFDLPAGSDSKSS